MISARLGDKKQTRRQSMAEMVFSWGVSELKCIIFKENNENPYENYNNFFIFFYFYFNKFIRIKLLQYKFTK